jgi:acetylornithine deacetylase/succinyl-diaminopimelate desuccinylase-like protein
MHHLLRYFPGAGMKTVVPRVSNAKLSCRLVPNMSPDDIAAKVKAHLESKGAELLANVTVKVSGFRSYPWTSPHDTPGGVHCKKMH